MQTPQPEKRHIQREVHQMPVRQPCAPNFYTRECREEQIEHYLKGFKVPEEPTQVVGGIVPHAGWMYSGAVAAKVFKCIKEKAQPDTFVLFGAVHSLDVQENSVFAKGSWATPFGEVAVDEANAEIILNSLGSYLVEDPAAHLSEHSIEVQLPFIKYFFPKAKVVPIMVVPDVRAALIGKKIAEEIFRSKKKMVVVGTTDLTHYGDAYGFLPWGYGPKAYERLRKNDEQIIRLAIELKTQDILKEAKRNQNACGSGALTATVSAVEALGAKKGILLDYTTSFDISPNTEFCMAVGYAGIIF
jgi:MEMO1 family protein